MKLHQKGKEHLLQKSWIVIAALQETRPQGQGQLQEASYTFFWSGRADRRGEAGVAFAISNKIACKFTALPTGVSERIMTMSVQTMNQCYLSLINVYAPTMIYTDEEKDTFTKAWQMLETRFPRKINS